MSQQLKQQDESSWSGLAMAVTVFWVALVIVYVLTHWSEVTSGPHNNLGDFLAGVFGPVALMWLVFGYFQQAEALRLQHEELINSVAEQKRLVDAQNAQNALFERQLAQDRAEYQRQKSERERSSQPFLYAHGVFAGYARNGESRWQITLRCHINPCADLSFGFTDLGVGYHEHEVLNPGESTQTEATLPSDFDRAEFVVWYRDTAGRSQTVLFLATKASPSELSFIRQDDNDEE